MSYINKIQKGSQEYDVNDTRITITAEDEGKYLKVVDGSLQWAEVQGGGGSGTGLYKHTVVLSMEGEPQSLIFISFTSTAWTSGYELATAWENGEIFFWGNYGALSMPIYEIGNDGNDPQHAAYCYVDFIEKSQETLTVTTAGPLTFVSDTVTTL